MPPPANESRNYKLLFWILCQIDIPHTAINWTRVASDLGIQRANSAQRLWRSLFRDQMQRDVASRRRNVGVRHSSQNVPLTPKREPNVPLEIEPQEEGGEQAARQDGAANNNPNRRERRVRFVEDNAAEGCEAMRPSEESRSPTQGNSDGEYGDEHHQDHEMKDPDGMSAEETQISDGFDDEEHDYYYNVYDYEAFYDDGGEA